MRLYLQHLNFDNQYVPKGVTYYHTAILMDPNPIRTALNVCKYLISSQVSKHHIFFPLWYAYVCNELSTNPFSFNET